MAGFSEGAFMKKLSELNSSSQSIQTLSLWLIHHRKHHSLIVRNWFKELLKAKEGRKLTLMYLANDVIQNSKKKGPEFNKEFGVVLKKAFEHMSMTDEKIKASLGRLIHIWKERDMYDELTIAEYKQALLLPNIGGGDPPAKKVKTENSKREKHQHRSSPPREHNKSEADIRVVEVDGTIETHVHLSPHTPAGDPPEPEELIKAIQDLESSIASTDEATRERISNFPKEVSDISVLPTMEDKLCAEKLKLQVEDAMNVVNEYNNRLAVEIENRKKVTTMLKDFLPSQRELLMQAERTLEEYQDKLQKIYGVRQELKSHIQNLPDLTQLPDVTGGLAPLPSAGDLFNLN